MSTNEIAPWTRSVVLRYRPELRFYEEKTAVLRAFDDAGILHAFRVREEEVSALLGDTHAELVAAPDFIRFNVGPVGPDAEWSLLLETLGEALAFLRPQVTEVSFFAQHLLPLAGDDYDAARSHALQRVLGEWSRERGLTDFALLVDGTHEGTPFQAEFGVVSDAEVPARLSRKLGRTNYPSGSTPEWTLPALPAVAFFIDVVWPRWAMGDEPFSYDWLTEQWNVSAVASKTIAVTIYDHVVHDSGLGNVKVVG